MIPLVAPSKGSRIFLLEEVGALDRVCLPFFYSPFFQDPFLQRSWFLHQAGDRGTILPPPVSPSFSCFEAGVFLRWNSVLSVVLFSFAHSSCTLPCLPSIFSLFEYFSSGNKELSKSGQFRSPATFLRPSRLQNTHVVLNLLVSWLLFFPLGPRFFSCLLTLCDASS